MFAMTLLVVNGKHFMASVFCIICVDVQFDACVKFGCHPSVYFEMPSLHGQGPPDLLCVCVI